MLHGKAPIVGIWLRQESARLSAKPMNMHGVLGVERSEWIAQEWADAAARTYYESGEDPY